LLNNPYPFYHPVLSRITWEDALFMNKM